MFDVVALGESLIDFTPSGINQLGMQLFACNPGGAPANVLAMNAKLGGKTAFIGKVGDDSFGHFLKSTMETAGIAVSGLRMSQAANTTLAFVQLDEQGDRSFSFYRRGCADVCLCGEEVDQNLLTNCRIFHFGSVSLTDEPSRSATLFAAEKAKAAGAVISYDPNFRPLLWETPELAQTMMRKALPLADIIKVSEEEMELLTGEWDLKAGAEKLAQHGAALVLVTLGAKGAFYYTRQAWGRVPTYDVATIDTTGAGDAFLGALLFQISGRPLEELHGLSSAQWQEIVSFSNAAGSLTTAQKGGIPAMPTREEIDKCMREVPVLL